MPRNLNELSPEVVALRIRTHVFLTMSQQLIDRARAAVAVSQDLIEVSQGLIEKNQGLIEETRELYRRRRSPHSDKPR
jgi:hypothetical protein